MSTIFSFQSQLVSIMDALSKTAVLEISKLVEIESKMLKIEITRGRNEIASLTEKLQLMENLLWVAQGHRQEATEHSKTSGGRDDSVNNSYGRLELEKIPSIKSEKSCESISSSTQPGSFQQGNERPSGKTTSASREQPELILVKEEPIQVETGDSGIQSETANERKSKSVAEAQSRSSDRHVKALSDKQPVFTETFVTLGTQSSTVGLGRQETQWNPRVHSEYQGAQLPPAHANLDAGKSFARNLSTQGLSKNVKIHSLRNTAAKRFSCLQCGKSFRCFSQLEIHQRSHTGEKPFRCTLCGKRYAQKGHLYTHQRTHTGEKPYRCPICGKGFIQKCTLDMHQRTHTGEKPFVCVKCGKGFTKNCNLKKHLAVHIDPSTHLYSS